MKKISTKLTSLITTSTLFLMSALPAQAQTQSWSGVCISKIDPDVATIQGFQCLVANILSTLLTLIGMAGFVMLIIASFQWMLSGGNSQKVEKSRNTITYAVLGIVLALSSFMILNLIASFTGVDTILNFIIPSSDTVWQ